MPEIFRTYPPNLLFALVFEALFEIIKELSIFGFRNVDFQRWLNYVVRIQEMAWEDLFQNLTTVIEANFHLNGFVNRQIIKFLGTENQGIIHRHNTFLRRQWQYTYSEHANIEKCRNIYCAQHKKRGRMKGSSKMMQWPMMVDLLS